MGKFVFNDKNYSGEPNPINDSITSANTTWSSDKINNKKMDKVNPTGTGSLSLNRKADTTIGTNSVAEGYDTTASGVQSHAEGGGTTASADQAHSEGGGTTASGVCAHAEGSLTTASGVQAHAEGGGTTASGAQSHAEGAGTTASGVQSHAEGTYTIAAGDSQHVSGRYNIEDSNDTYAEIVGNGTSFVRSNARTLDWSGNESLAGNIDAAGFGSRLAALIPDVSTKMDKVNASGVGSFSLNRAANTTIGNNSFAEGNICTASGTQSHAEGLQTVASGASSHAEGVYATASGNQAHAEGLQTTASGDNSHSEGTETTASGDNSHAEGNHTIAAGDNQHVSGKYNIEDSNDTYAEIVGNGTSNNIRSNARTLDWSGNESLAGNIDAAGFGPRLAALIPSYIDLTDILTAGNTTLTIQSPYITTTGTYDIYTDPEVPYNSKVVTAGQIVITFDAQSSDLAVKVRIT